MGEKTRKKKLQQERFCLFDSGTCVPLCDLGKLMFLAFQRHNAHPFITLVFPLRALKWDQFLKLHGKAFKRTFIWMFANTFNKLIQKKIMPDILPRNRNLFFYYAPEAFCTLDSGWPVSLFMLDGKHVVCRVKVEKSSVSRCKFRICIQ